MHVKDSLIPTGVYVITNARYNNSITIDDDTESICATGISEHKWVITKKSNNKFTIQSSSTKLYAAHQPFHEENEEIIPHIRQSEWVIRRRVPPFYSSDSYLIYASSNPKLYWSLSSREEKSVLLFSEGATNDKNYWRFKHIGDSTQTNTVDVNIDTKTVGSPGILRLKNIAVPVMFDELCRLIKDHGCLPAASFEAKREKHILKVANSSSLFELCKGGRIHRDLPLLHYYHQIYRQAIDSNTRHAADDPPSCLSETQIFNGNTAIMVGGVKIKFHRTIRVPDNDKTHALPPDFGPFKIFNVAEYADRLPECMVSKGGIFICMYQREALWTSFEAYSDHSAVKVSVGGVNALTGTQKDLSSGKTQDYLAVKGENGQIWLDGIAVEPEVVRQFVAMPLGQGYTVEGQMTGKEDVGGLQIDVCPAYKISMAFRRSNNPLNVYKSPQELNVRDGDIIEMEDLDTPESVTIGYQHATSLRPFGPLVRLTVQPFIIHIKMCAPWEKTIDIHCEPPDLMSFVKAKIQEKEAISPEEYDITFASKPAEDNRTLKEYCVHPGITYETEFRPYKIYIQYGSEEAEKVEITCLPADLVGSIKLKALRARPKSCDPSHYNSDILFRSQILNEGLPMSHYHIGRAATLQLIIKPRPTDVYCIWREIHAVKPEFDCYIPALRLQDETQCSRSRYSCDAPAERGASQKILGFAAGGRISQKILRDRLPPAAYDQESSTRLHIHVLNSADFTSVTGLPAPSCPISAETYQKLKLPWYTLFDEELPSTYTPSALSNIKSVATLDRDRQRALKKDSANMQAGCGYCSDDMATTQIVPCGHLFCDGCIAGIRKCFVCHARVKETKRFAAPMRMPGREDEDGVEATSLQDKIVRLKRCATRGYVGSFKLVKDDVSALSGS